MKTLLHTDAELRAELERLRNAKSMPVDQAESERRIREELKYRENRANRMPPNW